MTHITRIKFRNFKSFRNVDITFSKGFVCLAGPNGSGKSNVCDGIRFVLGESSLKALRAKKVADLISTGSDWAEITAYVDGGQAYEIRRALRADGKTRYRLNGKRMTRSDVIEVLRPAGLSASGQNVIAQGEVQRITEMSAKERREMIDQVSGIAEFDEKKKEAMSELGKVEQKVNDATIVLKEREGYLTELEKEKDDALKYTELSNGLRRSKGSLIHMELKRVDEEHSRAMKRYVDLKENLDALEKEVGALDGKIYELSAKKDAVISEINRRGEKERIYKELEELRTTLGVSANGKKERERELERIKARASALEKERKTLEEKIEKIRKEKEEISARINEVNAHISEREKEKNAALENLGKADRKFFEAEGELSRASGELQTKKELLLKMEHEIARNNEIVTLKHNELERITLSSGAGRDEERKEKLRKEIGEFERKKGALEEELGRLFEEEKSLNQRSPAIDKKLLEAKEKSVSLAMRVQPQRESGLDATSVVLELRDKKIVDGIYGTVGELCSFDEQYAVAVEASAGQRLNYIIVEDVDAAARAIEQLKQRKAGRCTFIPLDRKISSTGKEAGALSKASGARGMLIDFVKFDAKYYAAFNYAFGDTILVDDINAAKKLGVGKARMVTLEGDVLEASGIITGGIFKRRPGLAKERAELERLEKEVSAFKAEHEDVLQRLYSLREEMSRARKEKAEIEVKTKGLELELKGIEEREARERDVLESSRKAIESLKKEIGAAEEEMRAKEKQKNEAERAVGELEKRHAVLKASLDAMKKEGGEHAEHKKKISAFEKQINELIGKRSSLEGKSESKNGEVEIVNSRVSQIDDEGKSLKSEAAAARSEIKQLEQTLAETTKLLEEKTARASSISAELEKLFAERDVLDKEIEKLAVEKGKYTVKRERINRELGGFEVTKATLETKLTDLKAEFASYADIIPMEAKKEELEAKITADEQALLALGNVNLKAPEIYEEKKRDIQEIKEKVAKLVDEKSAVMKMIDEIETKKINIFMQTFIAINDNFRKLFGYIFKGEGILILDKPQMPFESGLGIRVKTEDDKIKYLDGMSGGEKSLITLIFIFSMHMYRPAPFYILDEVEAALDKENSKKLADLLKQLAKDTQFIVVTHNDAVLSSADSVIGVSMTKSGSKLVGIELSK